jgi:predicted RNA-binding Zn ribbon-like protein
MADGTAAAPHDLDLVIDFVNTLDIEEGEDALASPDALRRWLLERELLDRRPAVAEADRRQAVRLREALRELMLANAGETPAERPGENEPPEAELERAARAGRLQIGFDAGATVRTLPDAEGVPGALAQLLVPVADAMRDGTWSRVKACRADDCHWAFYDRSRNRSGVWCEMAVCGNRTKVRTYRSRRR